MLIFLLILIPLIGIFTITLTDSAEKDKIKIIALYTSIITFLDFVWIVDCGRRKVSVLQSCFRESSWCGCCCDCMEWFCYVHHHQVWANTIMLQHQVLICAAHKTYGGQQNTLQGKVQITAEIRIQLKL